MRKPRCLGQWGYAACSVRVVYEAGPTGFGLYRALGERGYDAQVIAPSLIPRRAGDRIKNDRRDCLRLAQLARAGELKAIWVPDPEHEGLRNLWRAREDAVQMRLTARQQLNAFLLRQDRRYEGKSRWNKTHAQWIAAQRFECAPDVLALTEYQLAVEGAEHLEAALPPSFRRGAFALPHGNPFRFAIEPRLGDEAGAQPLDTPFCAVAVVIQLSVEIVPVQEVDPSPKQGQVVQVHLSKIPFTALHL